MAGILSFAEYSFFLPILWVKEINLILNSIKKKRFFVVSQIKRFNMIFRIEFYIKKPVPQILKN